MKHIQKIVKITYVLHNRFLWNHEQILAFIDKVSEHEERLRKYNEGIALNDIGNFMDVDIVHAKELRKSAETSIERYLLSKGVMKYSFSHDPRECPIKMDLGKEYANYEDNKSFVIDL